MFVTTPSATKFDNAESSLLIAAFLVGAWTTSLANMGSKFTVTSSPCLTPESTLIPGPEGATHVESVPIAGRNPLVASSA